MQEIAIYANNLAFALGMFFGTLMTLVGMYIGYLGYKRGKSK